MNTTTGFSIETLELGPMENLIYLIHDHATKRAAIVDPAWDVPQILALAKKHGVNVTDILLTHSHHDHINGINEVLDSCDAQLHLLKDEVKIWDTEIELPNLHHGGDEIMLGNTPIKILHTPGHSPGSACYHIEDQLITGDTLFVFGCGHCKLAQADPETLHDSLRKMAKLPPQTVIHPGHNYAEKITSTIEEQIEGNPFMHFEDDCDGFVEYRTHEHDRLRTYPFQPIARK